jgi:CheY-like chemotaxis protein
MTVTSSSDQARQALAQNPPDLGELDHLLTTTTQAALDCSATVKQLLIFTHTSHAQADESIDLSSVVRDAAQLTAPRWRDAAQAQGRPISLDVQADGQPTIHGSPIRLRELMTGLIFNAVDALPAGGEILLRVYSEAAAAIVEVIDSGVGMSDEVQARVFEPGLTVNADGTTGFGLATVFGIVEQQGGRIEVSSAPGAGTTFRLSWPLVEAEAVVSATPLVQLLQAPRGLRVLAVDNEPLMTRAVVCMLRPSGHLVSVAESGEDALEQLAGQPFDVVVSDIGMGAGMNGWELAETVKRRWPNTRFLLATGWAAELKAGEAQSKGVEAILGKPYRHVELLDALARPAIAA